MARGNTRRARRANNPIGVVYDIQKKDQAQQQHMMSAQSLWEDIDGNWKSLPPQLKPFVLKKRDLYTLNELAMFWSAPAMIEFTRVGMASNMCARMLYLASLHLKLDMFAEARMLIVTGSFLHQCVKTPIEAIVRMCGENFSIPVPYYKLPQASKGFRSIATPEIMQSYIDGILPEEYRRMMSSYNKYSNLNNKRDFVNSVSSDWNSSSSSSNRQKPSSKSSNDTQIQLVLVDETNGGQRHRFDIGSSTTLKTLFNNYADERGVSLRSLRFLYHGTTLFLSNVGNKTPDEMEWLDNDVINVYDTSSPQHPNGSSSPQMETKPSTPKKSNISNCQKKTKRRGKKGPPPTMQEEPRETLEAYKARHSKLLTKLHDEAQPHLKEIRNRLNALDLERQPPKQKKANKRKKKSREVDTDRQLLASSGIIGKAGKPYFIVQVGKVENLYMTKKSQHRQHSRAITTIDLHGCTKSKALQALNEKLPLWMDAAMKGEYPWVIPVQIICGCGNQILSETVQEWVKSTRNVGNAPKNAML